MPAKDGLCPEVDGIFGFGKISQIVEKSGRSGRGSEIAPVAAACPEAWSRHRWLPGTFRRAPLRKPPILVVHGNGDHAALRITRLWRMESNGVPHERMFAINFTDPLARTERRRGTGRPPRTGLSSPN